MPCLNGRHFSTNILQIESICKSGTKRQLRMSTPSAFAHPHILRTKFMSHHHSTPRHTSRRQGRNATIWYRFFLNRKYCTWEVMYISLFQPLSSDGRFLRMWTCKTYLYSFPKPVRPQGTTSAVKDYFSDLRMIFNVLENEHGEAHLSHTGHEIHVAVPQHATSYLTTPRKKCKYWAC